MMIFGGVTEELVLFPMVYFSSKSVGAFWSYSWRKVRILIFGGSESLKFMENQLKTALRVVQMTWNSQGN